MPGKRKNKMVKKKVCDECGYITKLDSKNCPNCKKNKFNEKYRGVIFVNDPEMSKIAKELDIKNKGIYAIRS